MKVRIQRFVKRFDKDGVVEFDFPDAPESSVNHQFRFDRLNDQSIEVFVTDLLWTEDDDELFVLETLDRVDVDDGE